MKDLSAVRYVIIALTTGGGGFGAWRIWKQFSSDFLDPYRKDLGDLRDRIIAAERKAEDAERKGDMAHRLTLRCEEREARLRVALLQHGIDVPEEPKT